MISGTDGAVTAAPLRTGFRWLQLVMGIVCMAMIANLQYGWTLFVDPIDHTHHWGRAAIQLAFTIFVVTETWLVPIEAWFVDKYGPRLVIMFGGVMITLSWILNSYADSLTLLYAAAIIGGMGAGAVYGTCVGNALKWFPDRRGLAAGATAAGFGAGAALTIVPIATMIATSGYQHAFFTFGIGQGVIVFVLAFFIQPPRISIPPKKRQLNLPQTKIDFTPPQVLRAPIFWVMYLVFVMVASGGLMTAAQIAPIAHDFKIADTPVTLAGFQMAALTFAISLDRIFDGFGRPFFGFVSDTIGRENTMFIAFGTAALMLLTLSSYGHVPVVFVLATAVYFGGVRRDLLAVPRHLRRHLRLEVRNHKQRHALHREGHGIPARSARQRDLGDVRVESRVRGRGGAERDGGADGAVRDQADAPFLHPRQGSRERQRRDG
ncbi:OFA family oxalate/formate antiporter-like MFS transporter [Bradyrhizobium sp. LM4.3]